jgi:membrane fusion protein (multidrug efflux system)
MAEPVLKLAPVQAELDKVAAAPKRSRRRLRYVLLFVIPLLATAGGLYVYLAGGRYITTDNAYVGLQKVLITPDISGRISAVLVREGERVVHGQPLFEIEAEPFRLAVAQAEARLAAVRTDFANVRSDLAAIDRLIELARQTVAVRQNDVDRKTSLLTSRIGSQFDVDSSLATLVAAKTQLEQLIQQRQSLRNQLLDDLDLPIEKFPPFMLAQAALAQAERDLRQTVVRAPIAGTATQVPNIQLGRFVAAGTPVLALMDEQRPWVDANPKETDVTYLRVGQPVTIDIDAFPDQRFRGVVASVSPGTGAQFAILPPQNAGGNWVKVVQRLPVRIELSPDQDTSRLRAGMSANIAIDTGRQRSLATLFGLSATADGPRQ